MKSKYLLVPALLLPLFASCAPPSTDTPTPGNAGTSGGPAGTSGGPAGTSGGEAGTSGGEAGTSGGEAGTFGEAGTNGVAGTTGQGGGGQAGTSTTGQGGGGQAGTSSTGAGGRGGTTGQGGRGGTTGLGGGGAAGTGAAGRGGTTGLGGGGAAGTGAAGAAGTAGAVDPAMVGAFFNGQAYYLRCGALNGGTQRVCSNTNTLMGNTNLSGTNHNHPLYGGLNRNDFAMAPGTAGSPYCITVRVQGISEAKAYVNDTETARSGTHFGITGNVSFGQMYDASADGANGWVAGGMPTTAGDYNVYGFLVDSPRQIYYLNSINTSGTNRQNHSSYAFSYNASFTINGGSRVSFFGADANRNAIANCADPQVESQCNPLPNISPIPSPLKMPTNTTITVTQPVNGQLITITTMSARAGACTCTNPATCS